MKPANKKPMGKTVGFFNFTAMNKIETLINSFQPCKKPKTEMKVRNLSQQIANNIIYERTKVNRNDNGVYIEKQNRVPSSLIPFIP
jgi:hypothetical protein